MCEVCGVSNEDLPTEAQCPEDKTDRELLEEIHASQTRVEEMVQAAFGQLTPALEAFKKQGVMGLLSGLK